VELDSGTFDLSDQEAIDERLRSRIPLEIESGLANYTFPIDAIPHNVLVKIAQNVLPLKELYAGILATLLYDWFKAALSKGRAFRRRVRRKPSWLPVLRWIWPRKPARNCM
jgi:hypothetical protein